MKPFFQTEHPFYEFKLDWILGSRNKVNHLSLFWMATLPLPLSCISMYLLMSTQVDNHIFLTAGVSLLSCVYTQLYIYVYYIYV